MALEKARYKLAHSLGEVLLYIKGKKWSSFLNDKVCILWDLMEEIPKSIKVRLSKSISIWQLVIFKNVSFTYYHYNKSGHYARAFPTKFPQPDQEPKPEEDTYHQSPPLVWSPKDPRT